MPRTVTLSFGATCTPYIHQPVLLQFSIGDTWVPPSPVRVPPSGKAPNKGIPVEEVANAARDALLAQITRLPIGMPSPVKPGYDADIGDYSSFSSLLEDDVDEIDVGTTRAGTARGTQLAIAVEVDATQSERDLLVKTNSPLYIWTNRQGWKGTTPGKVPHGKRRMPRGKKSRTVYRTGSWVKNLLCMMAPIGPGGFEDWLGGYHVAVGERVPAPAAVLGGFPVAVEYWAQQHHPAPLFAQPERAVSMRRPRGAAPSYTGKEASPIIAPQAEEDAGPTPMEPGHLGEEGLPDRNSGPVPQPPPRE